MNEFVPLDGIGLSELDKVLMLMTRREEMTIEDSFDGEVQFECAIRNLAGVDILGIVNVLRWNGRLVVDSSGVRSGDSRRIVSVLLQRDVFCNQVESASRHRICIKSDRLGNGVLNKQSLETSTHPHP